MKALTHYRKQLAERGLREIIEGRWHRRKLTFQIDNWAVGRLVELFGNKVTIDGVTLLLDNPDILTKHKSALYFGIYEVAERNLCRRYLDPSVPLIEIGGSIGGVSCITNRMLNNRRRHVVVECNPTNSPTLTRNRDFNRCEFSIEPFALAYTTERIEFNVVPGGWLVGNVAGFEGNKISVPTITLRDIVRKYKFDTFCLISDSEGAEVDMVENEAELIKRHVKYLIVETHVKLRGQTATIRMLDRLKEIGFEINQKEKQVYAMTNCRL